MIFLAPPEPSWWDKVQTMAAPLQREGTKFYRSGVKSGQRKWTSLRRELDDLHLEERAALVQQLWQMRAALDLSNGLDDWTIHAITGIDVAQARAARRYVDDAMKMLKLR